ncbi:hypothetical protein K1T71_000874 [Dendrolimus kikuchii]|uniref:Uncharacterized protein n=1 Tax=Dendrolimus kikuchii TaxID=765133 RepID=A0ACC1DG09_9NEOP|nr:hypothetical protein K1T71_000874 [Dendrolimus kikuchii]
MGQWKTLSKDAIPSQNLPKLNPDGTVMVIRKSRTVKYKECKKEDISGDKSDNKCLMAGTLYVNQSQTDSSGVCTDQLDTNLAYRLQTLNSLANNISPTQIPVVPKTEKQDAIMQTDPIQSEEDDTQPNNTYADVHDIDYYQKDYEKKDYHQKDDYIPQTNEEYNKEAEKYALERKSHGAYEKVDNMVFQKVVDYPKVSEVYYDKTYTRQDSYIYQNGYTDSAEILRNQQHNLQMLQEPHRVNENQNFFNENHIKQEIDINVEDDKFIYERSKETVDSNSMYGDSQRRLIQQQRLLEHIQQQVKQEPDTNSGCENVMQPQGSPYYQSEPTNNVTGGYYEQISRPGPELLIAKQNALAAHTQLWQNTMKRPFFYSETPPYNGSQLYHRYEDITRILQ